MKFNIFELKSLFVSNCELNISICLSLAVKNHYPVDSAYPAFVQATPRERFMATGEKIIQTFCKANIKRLSTDIFPKT